MFSGRGRFFWACKTSINLILEKLILAKTEEQRVEERGTSIWRDFHSVSYKMQALKPSTRREAWSGGGASCWDGSLSPCWLTFPSSSHSHSVILNGISKIHYKSPGTTFIILPGTRNRRGRRPCNFPGYPDQLWSKFCYFFRVLDRLYFPGVGACVCVYVHVRLRVCACVYVQLNSHSDVKKIRNKGGSC